MSNNLEKLNIFKQNKVKNKVIYSGGIGIKM